MQDALWQQCLDQLRSELPSHQFNTWLRPLSVDSEANGLVLLAPNRFIANWVKDKYRKRIETVAEQFGYQDSIDIEIVAGKPRRAARKTEAPVKRGCS